MSRYIMRRLLLVIFVVAGVIILLFTLLYFIPGDPAEIILGSSADDQSIAALREQMGLNDGYLVRLVRYVNDLTHLDLGASYISKVPVAKEIARRLPITMQLTFYSLTVAIIIGLPFGIISAVRQNTWIDKITNTVGVLGISVPSFWLGLELSLLFALTLRWVPPTGISSWKSWILPALTIGINTSAAVMRFTRSSVLEVIRMDYVRTARSKGQKEFIVIMRHVLKNSLIPVITFIGAQIGRMLGGVVIVESVFSIPGIGQYMVNAINSRDFPVIMGGVLTIALSYCMVNLLVDIIYAFLDPSIKAQYKAMSVRGKTV